MSGDELAADIEKVRSMLWGVYCDATQPEDDDEPIATRLWLAAQALALLARRVEHAERFARLRKRFGTGQNPDTENGGDGE